MHHNQTLCNYIFCCYDIILWDTLIFLNARQMIKVYLLYTNHVKTYIMCHERLSLDMYATTLEYAIKDLGNMNSLFIILFVIPLIRLEYCTYIMVLHI